MTAVLPWVAGVALVGGGLGLLIGSFLNVVAHRVPAGISVVSPPSACPGCGSRIAARDNVPVLSWLLLRGRCRSCAVPISARYPLVEMATGVAFVVVAVRFWPLDPATVDLRALLVQLPVLVAFLWLAGASVALALIDLEHHRLPDAIVLPTYAVGAVLLGAASLLVGDPAALLRAGVGAAALFVFYLALALVKPGAMGLGDVKLAGALGLYLGWLGWGELAVGAFAAFLLGGLVSVVLLATGRVRRGGGIPFGPWMLAGAWVGVLVGAPVADAYLSLLIPA